MSDSRGRSTSRATRENRHGISDVVPTFERSETLMALQELVDVAEVVPTAVARSAGLSTSELHALRHLMAGPVGPVELARLLKVTSAASSGVVDRLEARGHVQRRPRSDDKRRTAVMITDSGRAEVLRLLTPMFAGLADVDNALTPPERAVVLRYLQGAIAAMRAVSADRGV